MEEELADLMAKFVRLESENQSIRIWYTSHIILVWEGLQHLGEWMTRLMNAMVQVVGEDSTVRGQQAPIVPTRVVTI